VWCRCLYGSGALMGDRLNSPNGWARLLDFSWWSVYCEGCLSIFHFGVARWAGAVILCVPGVYSHFCSNVQACRNMYNSDNFLLPCITLKFMC
jgi:hypothetical protein